MRKIAVLNQKGGVGKTTTVANTAAALAQDGRRVVVVDFDPQAHLTIHLGVEPESVDTGAYSVLTGSSSPPCSNLLIRCATTPVNITVTDMVYFPTLFPSTSSRFFRPPLNSAIVR